MKNAYTDRGDGIGDGHLCKRGALLERIITDRGDAFGDVDLGKLVAPVERISTDRSNALGNDDLGKRGTDEKRTIPDLGHPLAADDGGDIDRRVAAISLSDDGNGIAIDFIVQPFGVEGIAADSTGVADKSMSLAGMVFPSSMPQREQTR